MGKKQSNRAQLTQYVNFNEVAGMRGISRSTLEREVRRGEFPKPVQLSANRVGWPVAVVESYQRKGTVALQEPNQIGDDYYSYTFGEAYDKDSDPKPAMEILYAGAKRLGLIGVVVYGIDGDVIMIWPSGQMSPAQVELELAKIAYRSS